MLAGLIHAGWNIVAKQAAGDARFTCSVAYVLVLYAMKTAPLLHVAPAREVSMPFAALIGGHLLGEGDRTLRVFGALSIAAGVGAVGLG